jgi:hypothetical protein
MSQRQISPTPSTRPPTVDELRQPLHHRLDGIIGFCLSDPAPTAFLELEKTLGELLRSLGCLQNGQALPRRDVTACCRAPGRSA